MSYSVNDRAWLPAVGEGGFEIPDGTHGKTIAFRVWMTTSDVAATPRFDDITVEWTRWKGKPTKPSGDGSGVSHRPDAGTDNGSGVYTYPSAKEAPVQPPVQPPAQTADQTGSGSGQGRTSADTAGDGSGVGAATSTTRVAPEVVPPPPTK